MDRGWRTGERADCSKHRSYGLETTQGGSGYGERSRCIYSLQLGRSYRNEPYRKYVYQEADLVSNTIGNKSVIEDSVNGYVCETPEEYAAKINAAMKAFPKELPERAYQDVLEIYNTEAMKKKYIEFYNRIIQEDNAVKR